MSQSPITIGIAGLTGRFARLIASFLLEHPNVALRGFVRDPSKLPSSLSSNPAFTIIQGQADDAIAARKFVQGCNIIICAYLGPETLMVGGQKVLIDACAAEGVPRYMASDFSLDYTKQQKGECSPKDPMIDVKAYVDQTDGVQGVHVLIGAFMDTFFSEYFQIWNAKEKELAFWGDEDMLWEATSYRNAAEFVAEVALDRDAVGVRKYLGDRKSMREIAELMHSTYGFRPKINVLGSREELYEKMWTLRKQYPDDSLKTMALFYQYYLTNGSTYLGSLETLDNAKYTNVKPETYEDFFKSMTAEDLSDAYKF